MSTTPTPSVLIDLGCRSVLEYAQLAPYVGPRGMFSQGPLRQLDRDCGRRFELNVVPYDIARARIELDLECEKHTASMARSAIVAEKIQAILAQADSTEDPIAIAGFILAIRDIGANPFYGVR